MYQCTLNGLRYTGFLNKGVCRNPVYSREKKYTAFRLQPLAVGNPVYSRRIRRYTGFGPGRRLIAKDLAIDAPEIKNARDKSIDLAKSDSVSDRNCHIIL